MTLLMEFTSGREVLEARVRSYRKWHPRTAPKVARPVEGPPPSSPLLLPGARRARLAELFALPPLTPLLPPKPGSTLQTGQIIILASQYFHISVALLLSDRRDGWLAQARQIAYFVATKATIKSFSQIAREFKRDHTTILYAVRRIERRLAEGDEALRHDIDALMALLPPGEA